MGEHQAAEPIDHSHEVHKPVWKANVGDIGAPNLERAQKKQSVQQIGKLDVFWMGLRSIWHPSACTLSIFVLPACNLYQALWQLLPVLYFYSQLASSQQVDPPLSMSSSTPLPSPPAVLSKRDILTLLKGDITTLPLQSNPFF